MSIEENKAIARRFVEEMMSGQHLERIDQFVAPHAVHHMRESDANYSETLRGVFGDPAPDWRFTVDDVIAEDDRVVVRCTASYTTWIERNKLGTPYLPGTRATVWHVHIFRIQNGKITDHWAVRDDWDAVVQFSAPLLAG